MKYNITEKRKKASSRGIRSLPVLILCVLIFSFIAKASFNAYIEMKRSKEAVQTSKMELVKLQQRQDYITEELKQLGTEGGKEAKLREKFGVGRPGEQVAIIVESEDKNNIVDGEGNLWDSFKSALKELFKK